MQPMIQRVRHCVLCGGDIASGGRIDRRYCSGSCRTLAYRARLQQHAKEPESIAPPHGLRCGCRPSQAHWLRWESYRAASRY